MKQTPQITADEAARLVNDGDVLLVGGFGMTGNPVHLLHALAETNTGSLTYIANNVGEPGLGGGKLLRNGQIKKAIGSFFTSNPEAVAAAQSGTIEFELIPQGSLAEAIRAGGAGIGGFFTPTAYGTVMAKNQVTQTINGKSYVLQEAIRGHVAFIRAWKADTAGNLVYRMTEQNFNRAMATAADLVIAEAEHIVPVGDLDPNMIHTPGTYVDYLVEGKQTLDNLGSSASIKGSAKKNERSTDEHGASRIARASQRRCRQFRGRDSYAGGRFNHPRTRHHFAHRKWDAWSRASPRIRWRDGFSCECRQNTSDSAPRQ